MSESSHSARTGARTPPRAARGAAHGQQSWMGLCSNKSVEWGAVTGLSDHKAGKEANPVRVRLGGV